ncbi:MAG: helix-turn-helix domain-containing protein [Bacteroidota bacterium]
MNTHQAGYYSTKELSHLFHVDESTVKRWTNGDKLKCFKTPGGHRKYTSDQVLDFIRAYHYELDDRRDVEKIPDPVQWAPVSEYNPDVMRELYFTLAMRGSVDLLVEVLQRCHLAHYPIIEIYENVIGKTVAKLLEMEEKETIKKEEVQKAASAMMESIMQFRLLTPRNLPNGKTAISASLTCGLQDIILLCAAHYLEINGWKVYYLGPNTTVAELAGAVRKYSPDCLCLPAEYVVGDKQENPGSGLASMASRSHADCMVFDYFHETPDQGMYSPYRILSCLMEFSAYLVQSVPVSAHAVAL